MKSAAPEAITEYLLGELPAAESEAFEARVFADDALFDRVQAVESELFQAYAQGQLPPERRARFEARLLRQEGAGRRIQSARAARRAAPLGPGLARAARLVVTSLAAATVVLLAFCLLTAPWGPTVEKLLRPGGTRAERLLLPADARAVTLVLALDSHPGERFTAVVEGRGAETWRSPPLVPAEGALRCTIPAADLPAGQVAIYLLDAAGTRIDFPPLLVGFRGE